MDDGLVIVQKKHIYVRPPNMMAAAESCQLLYVAKRICRDGESKLPILPRKFRARSFRIESLHVP